MEMLEEIHTPYQGYTDGSSAGAECAQKTVGHCSDKAHRQFMAQATRALDEIADVENILSTSNNPDLGGLAKKTVMERRRRFQENPQEVDTARLDELDQLQHERTTYEKDGELTAEEIAKNIREYEELFPESLEEMRRHHDAGLCKPCRWFFKTSGCRHGSSCQHCHFCPASALKGYRENTSSRRQRRAWARERAQAARQDCSQEKTGAARSGGGVDGVIENLSVKTRENIRHDLWNTSESDDYECEKCGYKITTTVFALPGENIAPGIIEEYPQ